ncbi:hypothetical protein E4U57_000908 [Claviceps arundinis]|uniref:YAG7-like dimerisation domain-containing protein n=1 Tax=Claviceps arundinis TaxID=1623583 RepID=A0A9P7MYX1_9HYPO|nr:hypothetical protein E4U57_000908 [Claviceps arundinis]KAG5976262.1 hypothetical protein E4U56_002217 [Claviceps arundinis]
MAATTGTQPASKGSKKKLAKNGESVKSSASSAGSATATDRQDESYESPYIKELQKNIRNLNKKITNASKTDSILSQHAGIPLDELVSSRIINTDQKAQIEKKPALQAQLVQLEEQLVQYQKIHEQYRSRAVAEKAEWEKSLEKEKADAVSKAQIGFQQSLRDSFLTLSQFLRLAAYRREEASETESEENQSTESQAIEGVLMAIYTGDDNAVSSMLKLVHGTDDKVLNVSGETLQTSYAIVKSLAEESKSPLYEDALQPEGIAAEATVADAAPAPTVGTQAVSHLNGQVNGHANGHVDGEEPTNGVTATVDAAKALAESQEKAKTGVSQDRKLKAGNGPNGSPPPAAKQSQSWADDQPEPAAQKPHSSPNGTHDGFHSVQRNKSRQETDGSGNRRGRGRGEHRGRGGHRGDGRGRGRGRGGVPPRPRRNEEAS